MRTALLITLCVFIGGCGRNYELDAHSFTPQYLEMVEQSMGVPIPEGSHGLNLYNAQVQKDPAFIAKIEIPKESVEGLVKSLESIHSESITTANPICEKVTWWHPTAATTRIERRYHRSPTSDLTDIILCEEDGRMILYVAGCDLK